MAEGRHIGFYGKLPSHGDFVRRRVAGEFLGPWDDWLAACMHQSRGRLGDAWLEAYLTSPIWRFALSPRVCGASPSTGVLMPSVDSVGRYYPLTLVHALPAGSCLPALPGEQRAWFEALEELALSVLDGDHAFDLEAFDEALRALGEQVAPRVLEDWPTGPQPDRALRFELESLEDPGPVLLLAYQVLLSGGSGFSLWWTEGSEAIAPCLFAHPGLPRAERFPAMIDGDWARHGWDTREVRWRHSPAPRSPSPPAAPLQFRSAAASHAGKVRETNEDAWLNQPERGLWCVADGVGGAEAGEEASRSVVAGLEGTPIGGELQERVNAARDLLRMVNGHLGAAARRGEGAVRSASTVVALLAGARDCCWLWAGDSRLYRLRDDALEQCTRDHSIVEQMLEEGLLDAGAAAGHPQSNVITRAVGGGDDLELETRYSELRPGDRYLLCSDGVHGCIDDAIIRSAMTHDGPQSCADALLAAVLGTPASDNATAVVVFVDPARGPAVAGGSGEGGATG